MFKLPSLFENCVKNSCNSTYRKNVLKKQSKNYYFTVCFFTLLKTKTIKSGRILLKHIIKTYKFKKTTSIFCLNKNHNRN